MSLRRFKNKLKSAREGMTNVVESAMEKAKTALDTDLTLEKAEEELIDDLEKGLRIFDEIGLEQDHGDRLQEEIAGHAVEVLRANFPKK